MKRTHTCGELRDKDVKKTVLLNGWCHSRRDHGGLIFIDLRDRYGLTQIVFDPKIDKKAHKEAEHLNREDVVSVEGVVKKRKSDMENSKLPTGKIEIFINKITILNKSDTPPFETDERSKVNEDTRLKYRYLDLRRPKLQKNIIGRHKVVKITRDYFDKQDFVEIETPILGKSTPEGARDYLVPSRVNAGKFYALPQSPQIFKQLLMVSGFDKYFQIAKCFRDEDLRADRQPEFTQIDLEMSFIDEEDIYTLIEGLLKDIWNKTIGVDVKIPFPRMKYKESVDKYGIDRPDTRFKLHLVDVSDIVKDSDFQVFKNVVKGKGIVKCINAKGCAEFSRKDIEGYTEFVGIYGAKGLAWMKVTDKGLDSSIVKFFDKKLQNELVKTMDAKKGDMLFFVADKVNVVNESLAALRLELGKRLELIDNKKFNFLWVTDFPLMEFNEEEQKNMALHHPFTSPVEEDMKLLEKDPLKVNSRAYDVVLNGTELGGGSIRIHRKDIQEKMFNALGISKLEAEEKFGFLMEAFRFGTPPHGGLALGLDRLVAMLSGEESIREVIAFPKNKAAESMMDNAPNTVDEKQLDELHIKLEQVTQQKDVLFEKIKNVLDGEKFKFDVIEHKAVFTSEEASEVRGTKLKQGCKALILKTNEGFVQVVVPGDKELDIKKFQKETLFKETELANANEVKKVSGCNIGAVPPFGNLFGIKVYFDKKVLDNEEVAFNAGSHTKSLKLKAKDLEKVVNPVVGDYSK